MKLSDCIDDYVNYIRHERGLAKTTVRQYASWLRVFTDWLSANGYADPDLSAFNVTVLRRYQYDRARRGLRPRGVRSTFYALRNVSSFLRLRSAVFSLTTPGSVRRHPETVPAG